MNKKAQEYIDSKRKELSEIKSSERESFLIGQELYDKVYAPDQNNVDRTEYPYYDRNEEDGTHLYYKAVAINLTDKEYEEVYAAYKAVEDELEDEDDEEEENDSKNNMSVFMIVASVIIYIAGFVGGIIAGNNFDRYGFTLWLAIAIWVPTFVYGSLLLGVSEIIKLLHRQCD